MPAVLRGVDDLRARFGALTENVPRYNPQAVQTQLGRSIIAGAQLLTLLFTDWRYLTADVLGRTHSSYCDGIRTISIYCLGSSSPSEVGKWIGVAIAVLVIAGLFPRYVSVLHAWLALSMSTSLSLPDGGESVAVFSTTLLIFVLLPDRRKIAWKPADPNATRSVRLNAISYAAALLLCVQLAGIYFESGLAKLAVADWVNGSAMFYISRDPMFGSVGPIGAALHWATTSPIGTAALTWGVLLLELSIATLFLSSSPYKKHALLLVLALHSGIAIAIGLWSFSMIMIGTAVCAAYKLAPAPDCDLGRRPLTTTRSCADPHTTGKETLSAC